MTIAICIIAASSFVLGVLVGRRGPLIVSTTWYSECKDD
jgi:hypothetical protein